MENLDKLFEEIRGKNVQILLFKKEELEKLVTNQPTVAKLPSKNWLYFAKYSVAASLIIALASYFLLNNSEISNIASVEVKSEVQNQADFINIPEVKKENIEVNQNSNAISPKIKKSVQLIRTNTASIEEIPDLNSVDGLKMMVLSNDELKSLNIFIKNNTINFSVDELIDIKNLKSNPALKEKLQNLNYPVDNPQFLTHSNIFYSFNQPNSSNYEHQYEEYKGLNKQSHTCISPIKFEVIGSAKNKSLQIFDNSPVFKYVDNFNPTIENDDIYKTIYDEINPEHNLSEAKLVPVFIKNSSTDAAGIVLWYVPTEDFVNNLPSRYKEQLKAELNILNEIQNSKISADNVCEVLAGNQTYLNICKQKVGAIEKMTLYPNPAYGATICKYKLNERKNVKISIHDINGKFIKELQKECNQEPGVYEIKLDINNLNSGNYLVAITTDDCNQSIEKLIIK